MEVEAYSPFLKTFAVAARFKNAALARLAAAHGTALQSEVVRLLPERQEPPKQFRIITQSLSWNEALGGPTRPRLPEAAFPVLTIH